MLIFAVMGWLWKPVIFPREDIKKATEMRQLA